MLHLIYPQPSENYGYINWASYGNDTGEGTTGVVLDTGTNGTMVAFADAGGVMGSIETAIFGYTDQRGHVGGQLIRVQYDMKGDAYSQIGVQGGSITNVSGVGTDWINTDSWIHYDAIFSVDGPGVNGFSFYLYDNSTDGRAAYMDNLSFTLVPEPMTMSLLGLGGLALIRRKK